MDKPATTFHLKRVEVFNCISKYKLLNSITISCPLIMDVIVEFYSNLSLGVFDIKSVDYPEGLLGKILHFFS